MRAALCSARMQLIALAGLPGTGKSTVARALAARLAALVIDKDVVRAALFGASVDYTREQDELVIAAMYSAVDYLARNGAVANVVLDGRTFSKRTHVDDLRRAASRSGAKLFVVECVSKAETARARLERDAENGAHVARNRSYELYRALAASADPIAGDKLVLETDSTPPEQLAERCIVWLRERGASLASLG